MNEARNFAWLVVAAAAALLAWFLSVGPVTVPPASTFVFWVVLLLAAELLPVTLGFGTAVTMAFPVAVAVEILFPPAIAMAILGLGSFDVREIRREIPVWHALFNRAQVMLAAGAASAVFRMIASDNPFAFPLGVLAVVAAATTDISINLGLVAVWVNRLRQIPLRTALVSLPPRPVAGFFVAQALLAALGAATAAAYLAIDAFVAAFLIPLLFARLSIVGARTQQELSERVQKQQEALLKATESVFNERERERKRIAEEIHDAGLQLLAAASYSLGNAQALIDAGRPEEARKVMASAKRALDDATGSLRESLVDLRRSAVEAGGLMETIHGFADQLSTLWDAEVVVEGDVRSEPPVPVALAAFQILQEAVINALKHARSGTVNVTIEDIGEQVRIIVSDEGTGFDPGAEVEAGHVGMRLMRERAASVGGSLSVDSRPGAGTRLEAVLPAGVSR